MIRRIGDNSRVPLASGGDAQPVKEKAGKMESLKRNLEKLGDAVHRYGITLTGMLPFSTRGVIINAILAPFLIPFRMLRSIGPDFSNKMKAYMDQDWNQGIKDFYIDLEAPKNDAKKREVYDQFNRYADQMYQGIQPRGAPEVGILIPNRLNALTEIEAADYKEKIDAIVDRLRDMGFKVDPKGNFYDVRTGTMFNLIFDKDPFAPDKPHEIVVCIMGLGNDDHLRISDDEKMQLRKESIKAAGADWFGGIPPSARQAIEIGKILKECTANSKLNPVMVGHSHGGALAQTGAVANGIKGVAFNSRPMGAGTRRYIGQTKIAENAGNITVFSGKGDWLSGTKVINFLSVIFERLTGIPVPRSVGTGYHMPNLEGESKFANHVGFQDAMKRLG